MRGVARIAAFAVRREDEGVGDVFERQAFEVARHLIVRGFEGIVHVV